jgi:hypothetical protein
MPARLELRSMAKLRAKRPGEVFWFFFSKKNFFLPLPGKASLEFRRYVKRQLHPGFHDFYW